MKTIKILSVAAVVLLLIAGVASYMIYRDLTRPGVVAENGWLYITPQGEAWQEYADTTQADGVRRVEGLPETSVWCQRLMEHDGMPKAMAEGRLAGAYRLSPSLSALAMERKISRRQQDAVRVPFNNCRLPQQWAGKVARKLYCDSTALYDALMDPAFLDEIGSDSANVIAHLLPDTYELYWTTPADEVVRRMEKEYQRFWNEVRQEKAEALGLSPEEIATLASIAEEETRNRSERGVVARLYWNRLQLHMPLQADPTIKFALGDFGLKRILNAHLTVNSPYNTYLHEDLPPGPIRMVEKATIDTILNSRNHTYLYMCAKPELNGLHNFARTYSEHLRNAALYHNRINQAGF